ncbi:SWIM zinc finger family protein [Vibrio vulnificus]
MKGSNVYQVSLDFTGDLIAACTCPAAQYQRLCKHSVAVAMSLIEQPQLNQESERETIKKHLQSLGEETRLEMLLDYLEEDEYAWNALLTKIEIREKPAVYGELKKLVTQALPREQLWDWRESHAYFHSAENQLSMIIESMQSLDTEQQWKLINYLVERLNKVLEQIDDSSGDRFGIESLINEHMPNILAKLNWSEQEKAHWMFERLTHHEFDVFPSIEENFAVVWQNNTYFLDLCRQAIEQASPDESGWNLRSWANPLIKQSPNWRDVVAIKQKIARTCRDFLEIVEMYIDNQAPLEAEFWLAKARKIASEYERQACEQAQFRLYVELLFKNSYRLPDQFNRVSEQTDALVLFYIDNQQFDQACEWVASNRVSTNALLTLADLVVHDKPNHALSYYLRVVTVQIEQTNNEAYATALTLLQKIEGLLKSHSAELAQFYVEIASLAQSYKRKRNMLTLLKQHYAAHL